MSCGTNTPCRDENMTHNNDETCQKAAENPTNKGDVGEETFCEVSTEKVDFDELHQDDIITEVIVHAVSEPTETNILRTTHNSDHTWPRSNYTGFTLVNLVIRLLVV